MPSGVTSNTQAKTRATGRPMTASTKMTWMIQLGSGTGEYQDLKGGGQMYIVATGLEEDQTLVATYTGIMGPEWTLTDS